MSSTYGKLTTIVSLGFVFYVQFSCKPTVRDRDRLTDRDIHIHTNIF